MGRKEENRDRYPIGHTRLKVSARWFFLEIGMFHFADSESSILRAIYVLSHPVIVACLLIYAACLCGLTPDVSSLLHPIQKQLVEAYASASSFPHETSQFYSAWVIGFPLMTFILAPRIYRAESPGWFHRWQLKSTGWRLTMIPMVIVLNIVGVIGFLIPGDPSFCKGCTTHSTMGLLAIYGLGAPIGIALLLAAIPALIASLWKPNH